jgi:uncharacterized NAD-dependent epimerase/dehydratase family protein
LLDNAGWITPALSSEARYIKPRETKIMITSAPFRIRGRKALLLANHSLSPMWAKTAVCFLMYRAEDVVAVLDSDQAGKTAADILGFGGQVPVVSRVEDGTGSGAEIAVVGTAPMGGVLDDELRGEIIMCLEAGLDVVSGLHVFLEDDTEIAAACRVTGARVWDVRRVHYPFEVSQGEGCTTGARTVLIVGSDCNVGKMTVSLELCRAARRRGIRAAWAATGQTGMLLRERGICVDRVIADFIGGAAQELVNTEGAGVDLLFVEGQGAVVHPGYGADAAGRGMLKRLQTPILSVSELVSLHERLMAPFKPSPVAGFTLNTSTLETEAARAELDRVTKQTGLPAADVVRFGCDPVLDAVL